MPAPLLDSTLLDRYLASEHTPEEGAVVTGWLAEGGDAARAFVETLRRLDREPAPEFSEGDSMAANAVLEGRIRERIAMPSRTSGERSVRLPGPRTFRIGSASAPGFRAGFRAGVVLLAIAVASVTILITRREMRVQTHTYRTAVGERRVIDLADGSRMTLAPQSQLTVGYQKSARQIDLVGEALFEVRDAAAHPFVVRTHGAIIRVLGTRFDVRRYATDRMTTVRVSEGRVSTGPAIAGGAAVVVTAGSMALVPDSAGPVLTQSAVSTALTWTNNTLSFDGVPAATVFAELARWYAYDFRIADSALASRRVTAVLNVANPKETLADIAHLLDASMTIDGSVVTLRPNTRRSASPGRWRARERLSPTSEAGK
jgi:transmembrane sensor